jgi:predicted nucleotidyltransferase
VIDSGILKVLQIIVRHLKGEDVRWTIMGSVSLALQGIDTDLDDVDLLTDEHGAFKISALLKEFEVKPVSFSRTDPFESFYGIYDIEGTKVDVMGDLRVRLHGTWVSLSDRLKSPSFVQIDTMNIPVSSLHDQLLFYEKLGREKDRERILKIREVLK